MSIGRRRRSYGGLVNSSGGGGTPAGDATPYYWARAGTTNPFSMTTDVTQVHFEENVEYDVNGDWDDTNHELVCSEAGLYIVSLNYSARFGDNISMSVWLNNTEYQRLCQRGSGSQLAGTVIMSLEVDDIVDFRKWAGAGSRLNGNSDFCFVQFTKIGS